MTRAGKEVTAVTVEQDRIEVERLNNLISGFGWNIKKQEFTDEEIEISISKKRSAGAQIPEADAG